MAFFTASAITDAVISGPDGIFRGSPVPMLTLMFVPDEEIGSDTSRARIEAEAKKNKYVLVTEPARDGGKIVTARKGVGRFVLKCEGRPAHSGVRHEDGRSAIKEMAHQIMPTMVMSSFVDRVPRKAMAYLVYSMFEVSPERALSYGIVSDVVPAAELDTTVDRLTAAMLKAPSISLRSAKEYIRSAPDMPVAGAIEYARNLHATINSAAEIRQPRG